MITEDRIKEVTINLLEQKNIHRELNLTSQKIRDYRRYFKSNKLSIGMMLEILNRAGALNLTAPTVGEY